jgi:phage baseplate assembly protein V
MQAIKTLLNPLKDRVMLGIARAVLKSVDDEKKLQRMQIEVLKGEVRDSVERFQEYGFTSNALAGAEVVVAFPAGDRAHGLIIAVDDRRYRLKALQNGEVALYTDEGDKVHLKRGRQIEVVAGTKVTIDTPQTRITGNVQIDGQLHVDGDIASDQEVSDEDGTMGEMRQVYNGHRHPENDNGGPTSPPNQQMT